MATTTSIIIGPPLSLTFQASTIAFPDAPKPHMATAGRGSSKFLDTMEASTEDEKIIQKLFAHLREGRTLATVKMVTRNGSNTIDYAWQQPFAEFRLESFDGRVVGTLKVSR